MVTHMDTDARETVRRYYKGSGRSLGADLAALASNAHGVAIFHSRLVALMKPVLHHRPGDWSALEQSPTEPDGWYVHLLAGDLDWARRLATQLEPLPWLCFQRGRRSPRPHLLRWRRILIHQTPTIQSPWDLL